MIHNKETNLNIVGTFMHWNIKMVSILKSNIYLYPKLKQEYS